MELLGDEYSTETIERIYEVKQLHLRLAGYYRIKSKDTKRIDELWKEINRLEAILKLDGIEL